MLLLVFSLALAGCTCAECDIEKLPHRGKASTPDELAEIVKYEAKFDCRSELYDVLSARTRDKYSRTEWRIGVGTIKLPAPYDDYKIVDVAAKGTSYGAIPDPDNADEAIANYEYEEPGKKKLKLRLLILREPTEHGPEWRLALMDQQDRIAGGQAKVYWWFDED